ncbi:hypothetical protein DFS33DRAFT_1490607 [Desarmillaria ectypa]|nr:hypothetical protein DFS33DRAFT_1490607 [Desarmillaria ectypa]
MSTAFAQHQREKHHDLQPTPLIRIVANPTPPATPASTPPAVLQPSTRAKITLVPLATLIRSRPTPTPPETPPCSFILCANLPLPANCRLKPITPCHRRRNQWYVAPTPYYLQKHSSTVPMLRDFLRSVCGIELLPKRRPIRRHLPSPTSSSESEPMSSRSSPFSPSASQSPYPVSQQTTSTSTLQWVGALTTPNPIKDTQYSRFRFIGGNVVSMRLDSQVLPAP